MPGGARLDQLLGDLGLTLQQGEPQRPYIGATGSPRSRRPRITGDHLAVRGRLLLRQPGRKQV
jgi:hypothetical protein